MISAVISNVNFSNGDINLWVPLSEFENTSFRAGRYFVVHEDDVHSLTLTEEVENA